MKARPLKIANLGFKFVHYNFNSVNRKKSTNEEELNSAVNPTKLFSLFFANKVDRF